MTRESFSPKIFPLFLLFAIVSHGSSVYSVDAIARTSIPEAPEYRVTVSSEAYPSSSASLRAATTVPVSPVDGESVTVINPVGIPVEVIGRLGKVARKRESGTAAAELRHGKEEHTCGLGDDDRSKEEDYKVDKRKTEDGAVGTARVSAERIARARISDEPQEEDYESEDDYIVARDEKRRRYQRRKAIAGRRYRDGPKIWDQWGKWTSCSASCGAGKLTRWRHCIGGGCSLGNDRDPEPKIWDQWGRWSCCTVTCGTGKYSRWRHCVAGSCVSGEKEAQIKSCELKRCS